MKEARAKQLVFVTGVISLSCVFSRAGEQVQFKGSTSVELPKPTRPLDDNRRMRMDPQRPSVEGGLSTAPPIDSSPLSDKKMREAFDKKKNWIFMNPYEQSYDTKTEEFMRGEKGTGLYDNQWMDSKEEKGLVQKFIEEKDGGRGKTNNRGENDERERSDRSDRSERSDRPSREADGLRSTPGDGAIEKDDGFTSSLPKADFEKSIFQTGNTPDLFRASPFEKNLERGLPSDPMARASSALADKEAVKQQRIEHEREFDQILKTRLGSSTPGASIGRLDGLTVGGGIGQLDLSSGGRAASPGLGRGLSIGAPSTVTFTDGGASLGSRANFDTRNFNDTISLGPKAPAYAPAAVAPAQQRPALNTAPFSLPFPQRKF